MKVAVQESDLELIASEALARYMTKAGESIRSLAAKVDVNRCTIDRLRRGAQKTCKAPIARRIEQELGLPKGRLFFAPETTRDLVTDTSRKSKEQVAA